MEILNPQTELQLWRHLKWSIYENSVFGLIERGGSQYLELYNCSAANKTQEQWWAEGKPRPLLGTALLTYGIVIEILYIPSLYVISCTGLFKWSCYKIMFLLGIIEMLGLLTNSIMTGYLLIKGAVFCTNPDLIFIFGAWGDGCWSTSCLCCLVLVVNRLMELWKPHLVERVFKGWKLVLILFFTILYGAWFFLFNSPILFNSFHCSWFYDPFIYSNRSNEYMTIQMVINNLLLCAITCSLYTILCACLGYRFNQRGPYSQMTWRQKSVFIQATAICMANFVAAVTYTYMQFFWTPPFFILLGHFAWEMCSGFPAIVYVTMNRSVRRDIYKLWRQVLTRKTAIYSTSSS